jgi:nitroreductase
VLICGEKNNAIALHEDCALAAAYFMFAATARGLATCWTGLETKIVDSKLRQKIGLTLDLEIIAPLIVGYASDLPPVPQKIT